MNNIVYSCAMILVVMLVIAFSIGTWALTRKINYSLSYKSMVEQTVKDMVKVEALKALKGN